MTADLERLHTLIAGEEPLTWVFTGDSITHGLVHTHGGRNYVEHLHELIRGDLGRARDAVINTAISGWRIPLLLEDFESRVARWQPRVVGLMIGTNDASDAHPDFPPVAPGEFAVSVTEFVRRVRDLGAIPVLQTQPTIDVVHAPERGRIAEFAQAIRDVAAAEEAILVDQFAYLTELGNGRVAWSLLNDPFHPNALGHAALALELARVLELTPTSRNLVLPSLRAQVDPR